MLIETLRGSKPAKSAEEKRKQKVPEKVKEEEIMFEHLHTTEPHLS
jgi:hypothetical protein